MAVPGPFFVNVPGSASTPRFARVILKGHTIETNGASRKSWNVFDFLSRAGNVNPSPNDLAVAFDAAVSAAMSAAFSDKYIADSVDAMWIDAGTFLPVVGANNVVGAIGGDRMPSGNGCVTMRLITNAAGRNFRGSKHFSPIAESDTTLDELTAGAQTRWGAVAAALGAFSPLSDAAANDWDFIVLSQELSNFESVPRLFTGAFVVTVSANNQIGTMRRRRQRP